MRKLPEKLSSCFVTTFIEDLAVVIGKDACPGAIVFHLQHPFYAYSSTRRAKCNCPIVRKATAHRRSQQKSITTFDHGGYLCHLGPNHQKKNKEEMIYFFFTCFAQYMYRIVHVSYTTIVYVCSLNLSFS